MAKTLLLVEDETDVMMANQEYLQGQGFTVLMADTLSQADALLARHPVDLILLDINLPDGSGLDYVRQLRLRHSIPVIFLTCRTEKDDVIQGLLRGGNDYVTKPYDLDVLHARILAQLRKGEATTDRLAVGGIELNITTQQAMIGGRDALLKPKEFGLLLYLMRRGGEAIPAGELYRAVWGRAANGDTRTVRVHIHALRKKLGMENGTPPYIETLPQEGYRFLG